MAAAQQLLTDIPRDVRRDTSDTRSSSSPSTVTRSVYLTGKIRDLLGKPECGRLHPRRGLPRGAAEDPGRLPPGPKVHGLGRHGRGRRGPEPAARAPHDQLRPAVEPEPHRAAVRPDPPDRPDASRATCGTWSRRAPARATCSSACSRSSTRCAGPTRARSSTSSARYSQEGRSPNC